MCGILALGRCGVLATVLALGQAGGGGSYVRRTGTSVVLGNEALELVVQRDKLTQIRNKLAKRALPIQSDGFSIAIEGQGPLRAADVSLTGVRDEAVPGGRRLILAFASKARGIQVQLTYELGDDALFIRRSLEAKAPKPLPFRQVDAWVVGVAGTCSHQGFGEPVLLDDTFWGLECPGGRNRYADGTVRLTHYPRRATDRFVSKAAVVGVAEPGRVAQRFRDYVATFQKTPGERKLFVNYNTWWTLMPPTEQNCLELIDLFQRKLFDPHGESFDTFTIDDGWDDKNSLWAIRKDRFPRGFAPLVKPLKAMNANLGLWLSPSSGYHHAPWLTTKGGYLKGKNAWYCVQADPKYRRDIIEVVTRLARESDLAFYKLDGFSATNEALAEGMPKGEYAREANIDAYVELLEAVRKTKPGVFLDPTCGMWLSPWWLKYVDSIWGSVSGDYPAVIVPAPVIRDSATTTRDAVFRQRCREHPGFPPAAIEHLGIIVITPEKWEDNAMAVVGRGCRLLTLYINPKHFRHGDRDWAFLAALLKWTRHNAATLGHTKLIGGDPLKREWYGYAHFLGIRGIIALRNPFIEPQTVKLTLDESLGWRAIEAAVDTPGTAYVARMVYPRREVLSPRVDYGRPLKLTLQGYETVVIDVQTVAPDRMSLLGVQATETERAGNRIAYAVCGRPGQKLAAIAARPVAKASLDGQPVPIAGAGGVALQLAFGGAPQACRVEGARLEMPANEPAAQIGGSCTATVPTGSKATMHVLVHPRGGAGAVECAAQVNGKAIQARAVRSGKGQAHSRHAWTWFEFPLPEGESQVAIVLKPSKGRGLPRCELGWWLWAEHPLQKKTLALELEKPLPPAPKEPLPLPIGIESERQIITVHPPRLFAPARVWPKANAPRVWLDEAAPDEARQDWGTLQRNRSVWGKPMIVAGRTFTRGLGTHANSRLVYELSGGKFKRFRCLVGRDEHAMEGNVVFQVWLDGRKAFDSGPMGKTTPAKPVEVDVSRSAVLELRTLDGGDDIGGDHGDWANAELLR